MQQWTRDSLRESEAVWRPFTLRWTTAEVRHELSVVPEQGTANSPAELWDLLARATCHLIIDQLPSRAYGELLETLIDMRDFHMVPFPPVEYPQLIEAKPLKRLSRETRAEVEFPDE